MVNGIPTAYRNGSQRRTRLALEQRVRRLRSGEQSQVLPGPAANRSSTSRALASAGDPWEASDWPSLRKATQPWLFDFRRGFPADLPRLLLPVTLLFLLLAPTSPNSTCSRAEYLCIIDFAYRAAEARSQMSQARRNSRESIGFFCRVRTCWPNYRCFVAGPINSGTDNTSSLFERSNHRFHPQTVIFWKSSF